MLSTDLYTFNGSTNRCEMGTRLNTIKHRFLKLFFQNVEVYTKPLKRTPRQRAHLLPSLEVRGKGVIKLGRCELTQTKQLFSPSRAASSRCFRGDSRQQQCTRGRSGRAALPSAAGVRGICSQRRLGSGSGSCAARRGRAGRRGGSGSRSSAANSPAAAPQ